MKIVSMVSIAATKVGRAFRTHGPCPAKALASKRVRSFQPTYSSLHLFLPRSQKPKAWYELRAVREQFFLRDQYIACASTVSTLTAERSTALHSLRHTTITNI
ncbi:unnamed protein product [Alternaria burnsii]|nr:unnamed protein product [Alternaria burnsii]